MKLNQSDIDRFRRNCVVAASGCVEWQGARYSSGYGQFSLRRTGETRKTQSSHRIAWIIHSGSDIPKGMMICHTCDNRACVNPDHLYVGTGKDNNADTVKRGRGNRKIGSACSWAKLKEDDVRFIKSSQLRQTELARLFGVDPSLVCQILSGKRWAHVAVA